MATHDVTNQVPPLVDNDVADDPAVLEAVARAGASHALEDLHGLGRLAGSAEAIAHADRAEEHPPVLETHDRYGNRIDEVRYDPSYHWLMTTAVANGLHGSPWADGDPHAHLIRAAKFGIWSQADAGHGCPISMTYAVVPALRANAELSARYEPLLTTRTYDFGLRTPSAKRGLIAGMSMTEKQGGSDVRANTTTAAAQADGSYRITGHKWFTSAPMSDMFLTLAQAPGGLSCFLVPRVLEDGTRNAFALQRLKNKLGNHSNASSEVEYTDTFAWLVGDEGRGVRTIIEMVNMTRLDCVLGTAAGMRKGLAHAAHHAAHRRAFGQALVDQPLMRNVLADLAVESEAATTVGLWLADLTDRAMTGNEAATALRRIALAVTKYHVCKRGAIHAAEALECLGGNGYVEESGMPRIYREAPLLSIWEGSGNVAALDVLRAMAKDHTVVGAFFDEIRTASGVDARYDAAVGRLEAALVDPDGIEFRARRVVGEMALLLQGSLLLRYGHPAVADAFVAGRLGGDRGDVFGTLPRSVDTAAIIERAMPKVAV